MRILTVSVVLSAAMLLSGCATLQVYQLYPAFGTLSGGRLLQYDRRGAHNVLPPPGGIGTQPAADAHRVR
jgi:hypothetical protein